MIEVVGNGTYGQVYKVGRCPGERSLGTGRHIHRDKYTHALSQVDTHLGTGRHMPRDR